MNLNEIDIVFVTFNSSGWIDGCFESYIHSTYPCKKINVTVIDNGSADDSLAKLENIKNSGIFSSFEIHSMGRNAGFGAACNAGFTLGNSDIVCFFNIDTEIFPDTLINLTDEIAVSDDKTAGWELRQFPYEHPKDYDILTGETDWCSAAAFAVRRSIFQEAGGFDERLYMYTEDVDLCFRIRSLGYTLKYCPKAVITDFAYKEANEIKPLQYTYSVVNNLLLRYRFGKHRDILAGITFSEELPEKYANGKYTLDFIVEAVQLSADNAVNAQATQQVFGVKAKVTNTTISNGAVTDGTVTWGKGGNEDE